METPTMNELSPEPHTFIVKRGRNRVPVGRPVKVLSFDIEDVGIVCQRLDCESSDVDCVLNKTKSIQWQFIALPSIPVVQDPLVLMNVKPIGYSVYPNIMFTVEGGNTEKYFDIVTHENSGNRGTLRLLKPIIGPKVVTLRLRMDNRNSYSTTISVHNAFIKIHVSDLNF